MQSVLPARAVGQLFASVPTYSTYDTIFHSRTMEESAPNF